ncbi:MAG: zinc-ribbon domain-containing protein [Clostridiales bacterium]|nr:zinc-ribbon domain-containing protein [Clostridiales bacterium]
MFCTNCGKEIPEGSAFCDACGAPVSAPTAANQAEDAQPEAGAVNQGATAQPDANAAYQSADAQPPVGGYYAPQPVKKRRKWPIAAAAVVVVVVVVAAASVVSGATTGFFLKHFGSAKAYYAYVDKKEFDDKAGDLSNWYGNAASAQKSVETGGMHVDAELSIDSSGLSLLSSYADMDLSNLKDIGLSFDRQSGASSSDMRIALAAGGSDLLTFTGYIDDASQLYLQIPELSGAYLTVDLAGDDYGVDASAFADGELNLSDYFPDSSSLKKLVLKYAYAAIADVKMVSKTSDTLTVNGVSEKCTVLTVKITMSDVANMVSDIKKLAESDEELQSICDQLADDMELMSGYREFEGDELYGELLDALDELEEDLSDSYYYGDSEYLKMQVYIGKGNEVIGRTVSYVDDDWGEEYQIFSYKEPLSGNKFALELVAGSGYDAVSVSGSGIKTNKSLSGAYKIYDGDITSSEDEAEALATISVSDLDRDKLKNGYLDGTFTVSLGSRYLGTYASLISFGITAQGSSSGMSAEMSLLLNGSPLGSLSFDTSYKSTASVSAPGSSDTVYGIDDADEYIYGLDYEKLFDILGEIGLPSDLLSELEEEMEYMLYW